jgi:hypothetical protein
METAITRQNYFSTICLCSAWDQFWLNGALKMKPERGNALGQFFHASPNTYQGPSQDGFQMPPLMCLKMMYLKIMISHPNQHGWPSDHGVRFAARQGCKAEPTGRGGQEFGRRTRILPATWRPEGVNSAIMAVTFAFFQKNTPDGQPAAGSATDTMALTCLADWENRGYKAFGFGFQIHSLLEEAYKDE